MKLYATVTSERASKGQGGNNELVINITVGNKSRREIANIVLRTSGGSLTGDSDDQYALEYYPVNRDKGGRVVLDTGSLEVKGNKQKVEKCRWTNKGVSACAKEAVHLGLCEDHKNPAYI